MTDAPCQHVVERASEGPCETCGHRDGSHALVKFIVGAGVCWESDCACSSYLGPVLKRCGHEESSHFAEGFFDAVTEPEHRPSGPRCERCYQHQVSVDETFHQHVYTPPPDA